MSCQLAQHTTNRMTTTTRTFARTLTEVIGPGRGAQRQFALRVGMEHSKLSRILRSKNRCERNTLDLILTCVERPDDRRKLVMAYVRDLVSPGALLHLKADSRGQWDGFDFQPLSPKGQAALKRILSSPGARSFEKVLIGMDEAFSA